MRRRGRQPARLELPVKASRLFCHRGYPRGCASAGWALGVASRPVMSHSGPVGKITSAYGCHRARTCRCAHAAGAKRFTHPPSARRSSSGARQSGRVPPPSASGMLTTCTRSGTSRHAVKSARGRGWVEHRGAEERPARVGASASGGGGRRRARKDDAREPRGVDVRERARPSAASSACGAELGRVEQNLGRRAVVAAERHRQRLDDAARHERRRSRLTQRGGREQARRRRSGSRRRRPRRAPRRRAARRSHARRRRRRSRERRRLARNTSTRSW